MSFADANPLGSLVHHALAGYGGSNYPCEKLSEIWGFKDNHVPAVHRDGWRDFIPSDRQAQFLGSRGPVNSHEFRPVPDSLRKQAFLRRGSIVARATLETLARFSPTFNRVIVGDRIVETHGITILITALDKAGHILAVPMDLGESYWQVCRRIIERRREGEPKRGPASLALINGYLPSPLAVVSLVEQEAPFASLLGSGAGCPTEVCVGTEKVGFTSDHRIYTPGEGRLFSEFWLSRAEALS